MHNHETRSKNTDTHIKQSAFWCAEDKTHGSQSFQQDDEVINHLEDENEAESEAEDDEIEKEELEDFVPDYGYETDEENWDASYDDYVKRSEEPDDD